MPLYKSLGFPVFHQEDSEDGFTLVEIMVAIAIGSIFMAIIMPTFSGQLRKNQNAAAFAGVERASLIVSSAYTDAWGYPTQITMADIDDSELQLFTVSVDGSHSKIRTDTIQRSTHSLFPTPYYCVEGKSKDGDVMYYQSSETVSVQEGKCPTT